MSESRKFFGLAKGLGDIGYERGPLGGLGAKSMGPLSEMVYFAKRRAEARRTGRRVGAGNLWAAAMRSQTWSGRKSEQGGAGDPVSRTLAGPLRCFVAEFKSRKWPMQRDMENLRVRQGDEWIGQDPPPQLVIVGAGFDTRAYRLGVLHNTAVYEVDFRSVLREKAERLRAGGCPPAICGLLMPVVADIQTAGWELELEDAGFDRKARTVWAVEGLLPDLSPADGGSLLQTIAAMSGPRSTLIATWGGEDDAEFQEEHGWECDVVMKSSEIAARYGKTQYDLQEARDWFYTRASLRNLPLPHPPRLEKERQALLDATHRAASSVASRRSLRRDA